MITAFAARVSPARTGALLERNLKATGSGPMYWVFLFSGVLEPLLYLLSIGYGVGTLIGHGMPYHGQELSYQEYVAPAMLAVSAVSGAMASATFGFFAKLRYTKTFEVMLATPVRSFEMAVAELVWAMLRGLVFTVAFLVVMVLLGLTTPAGAIGALCTTTLVGLSFGAIGMGASTLVRGWQDFDLLATAQTALFLFSGTFVPIDRYPQAAQLLIQATPLYHAVELIRGVTVGSLRLSLLGHAAYLVAMLVLGLWFVNRRMERALRE